MDFFIGRYGQEHLVPLPVRTAVFYVQKNRMSKEFIENKTGAASLAMAIDQQKKLSYFTRSDLHDDISEDYLVQWAARKYRTDDYFLSHIKSVFKTDNFLSFFKYYRKPNAASKLINARIKDPLSRVFFSEDSYSRYWIRNKEIDSPEELDDNFENKLFDAVLFDHNDIIVHDLSGANDPYRFFVGIDKVVSIEMDGDDISKIAFSARSSGIKGYSYMDSERYAFYDSDMNLITEEPHDLGRCPAEFAVSESFGNDPVVKKSMFTYLRADLEEYVFLKTLQRMTEPNGSIPVATILKTKERSMDGADKKGLEKEPMSASGIGGQQASVSKTATGTGSHLQTGSVVYVPVVKKNDGSVDIDIVKNLINFFYLPVEAMEYLNKRIKECEQNIIASALGDYSEANEEAKNEMQVSKSYVSKEDKLRWLSDTIGRARNVSDFMMLALKYGRESVMVDIFQGSDFFLETQSELYDMFNRSPNNIERKNILARLSRSRNRFNRTKSKREAILYKILPYASDNDFKIAMGSGYMDGTTFQLQTRFNYWVAMFEATYGNILVFWEEMEATESEKLIVINNLITDIIIKNTQNGKETNSTPASVQRAGA